MNPRRVFVVVLMLAGSFALGWNARGGVAEQKLRGLVLGHELERLGASAAMLEILDQGDEARLRRLLWHRSRVSVERAERQLDFGARIEPEIAASGLLHAVERARATAERQGRSELDSRLAELEAALVAQGAIR